MATYTIFCAIQHEWPPFSVHIEKSLTVDDLKKAIKAENPNAFASTDAHRLTLYQVDVGGSTRQERQENLAQATLTEDLDPFSKLNKLYPSPPPEDTIHILIQLPERSKRKLQDEEQDEESSLAGIKRLKKELSKGPAFVQPLSPARDYGSRKHRRSLPEDDILSHTKRLSVRAVIVGDPDISLDPLVDAETPAKLQGKIAAIRAAVDAIPNDFDFSDPANIRNLPFPTILTRQISRFPPAKQDSPLQDPHVKYFTYMGRSGFREICTQMENPDFEDSKVPIYVYGTSGYGKSYLLAALVCQLLKEGKRVVYFPDCQELAEDAYTTFLDALRFAYYDDPASLQKINSVLFIANADARLLALTDFWRENCDAYLVADQLNALESENDAKKRALELLVTLGYKHPYISSASANEKANRTLAAKQQNMEIVKFYGGMDKNELACWLHHYELQLPKLTEEEREYAVFQTGGIPLYLSQLLISKVNLEEPSLASLLLPVKRLVKLRVSEFFTRKTEELKTHTTRLTKYYQLMEACVSEKLCDIVDPDLYDHRYFYFLPDKNPISERERGRCICGIAQQAMLDTLFQLKFDDFNLDLWYTALERIAGNRAMQGIIAEKIILHGIYSNGLRSVNSQLDKMGRRFFDDTPDWSSNISRTLYVPTSSSFEAIDGIILMQAGEDAHLFPIQITIIPRHKDSESTFFAKRWGEWVKPLQDRGLKIHTTFVWIDLQPPSEKHRTARVQELRTRDILVNPEYRSTHLGISQVDSRLGELLSLPIYMLLRISS